MSKRLGGIKGCKYKTSLVSTVPGHWLFHVAWFPSRANSKGKVFVGSRGRRHVHSVHLWIFEKLLEVGVEPRNVVALGEVFGGFLITTLKRGTREMMFRGRTVRDRIERTCGEERDIL